MKQVYLLTPNKVSHGKLMQSSFAFSHAQKVLEASVEILHDF